MTIALNDFLKMSLNKKAAGGKPLAAEKITIFFKPLKSLRDQN